MHLVCSQCFGINNVPDERLEDAPKCGHCKQPVLSAAPVELDASNFDRFIGHNGLPVVVDFWAPWCGPCRSFAPLFAQAAAVEMAHFRFAKVDTEAHHALAARFGIRSIPTLAIFRDGQEVDRVSGALPPRQFAEWLAEHA
ncbi:thioredoxin 2 [Chitinivorax tropicus]|uniref:Thioredoxin n=1 Tax=Chitinivorax tropicus TaxID=714531 RepID=A0A840MID8_9PROT|nr:thioredoxin TrxC [Chitinivorax tropicus]MBB5018170.1 thioredoxin 2 [Chitinivorax tropicus]